MNSRILKRTVLGTFVLFAGVVFFISGGSTGARDKRAALLETVRNYKTWREVTKPPVVTELPVATSGAAVQIDISSIAG